MNLTLISNIRKLVEGFRSFDLKNTPAYLRLIAEIFEQGKDIFDAFIRPTYGEAEDGSDLSDDDLAKAIEQVFGSHPETIGFDPSKLLLVVELVFRLFERLKK